MASKNKLEIETRKLQNDIDSLRQQLREMKKKGDDMMSGIHALSSMWEGEAKEVFVIQFQNDYEILQQMEDTIEELIQNLEFSRERYDRCENQVDSIIQAIRV